VAEKKINGRDFRVTPMPAREALALYADLVRILAPVLPDVPQILHFLTNDDPEKRQQADLLLVNAQSLLLAQAGTSEIMGLLERVLQGAQLRRPSGVYESADIDGDFTDDLGSFPKVIIFILQENFRDFLSVNGGNGILSRLLEALHKRK